MASVDLQIAAAVLAASAATFFASGSVLAALAVGALLAAVLAALRHQTEPKMPPSSSSPKQHFDQQDLQKHPQKEEPKQDSQPQKQKDSLENPKEVSVDPFIDQLAELRSTFLALCDTENQPAGNGNAFDWQNVVSQTSSLAGSNFAVQVHQRSGSDLFFRVVVDLDASPEDAFDLLADISIRPSWDEVCESAGVLESVSPKTKIQFMRTKAIWPTAARAAIVVAFVDRTPDGRYLNVTKSIDSHAAYEPAPGEVRMVASIAGVLVGPHPSIPGASRCYQLMQGDLGGWLPKSVVALVTTQAFPVSLKRANKILRKIEKPKTISSIIAAAEQSAVASTTATAAAASTPKQVEKESTKKPEIQETSTKQVATSRPSAAPSRGKSLLGILSMIFKILEKAQPFMILALLIGFFFGRQK